MTVRDCEEALALVSSLSSLGTDLACLVDLVGSLQVIAALILGWTKPGIVVIDPRLHMSLWRFFIIFTQIPTGQDDRSSIYRTNTRRISVSHGQESGAIQLLRSPIPASC